MLGMAGKVDPAGTAYMKKKIAGTHATVALGKHPCPMCNGDGKRTITTGKLILSGIGELPVEHYRPLPEGASIRRVAVLREVDGWYVVLFVEIPFDAPRPNGGPTVGISLGINDLVTVSHGYPPSAAWDHHEQAIEHLSAMQRRIAKARKGSPYRRHLAGILRRQERHIANARKSQHLAEAKVNAQTYGEIRVKPLPVK